MIPWDELPLDKFKEMELKEGDTAKVIKQLKKTKLVIGLGLATSTCWSPSALR